MMVSSMSQTYKKNNSAAAYPLGLQMYESQN